MYGKAGGVAAGGVHPEGAEPSCLGGIGTLDGGISLSTYLYSAVDSVISYFSPPAERLQVRN